MKCVFWIFAAMKSKAFKTIYQYPALVATSMFTYWTFGSPNPLSSTSGKLNISWLLTWGQLAASLIVIVPSATQLCKEFSVGENFIVLKLPIILSITLFIINILTMILLKFLSKCYNFCCISCQSNCYPVLEETTLDISEPKVNQDNEHHIQKYVDGCILISYTIRE